MLFKFRKMSRKQQQQQQENDQSSSSTFVGRLSRSLSRIRQRKSHLKIIDEQPQQNNNNDYNGDNVSNCSSIELVRDYSRQSRPSSSASLLGVASAFVKQNSNKNNIDEQQQRPASLLSMSDSQTADSVLNAAAAPALASLPNFDNFQDAERMMAERRANYARRTMRRLQHQNTNKQEAEWMFKLYDLPGSETEKQDMSDVAKTIRKTLVSSLTPMLVETTSQLRQLAAPAATPNQLGAESNSATGSNSAAPTVHLHITMKPEVMAQHSSNSVSPCSSAVSASSCSNNNHVEAVCVVRVSAMISNEDVSQRSSTSPPAAVVPQEVVVTERSSAPSHHLQDAQTNTSTTGDMPSCFHQNKKYHQSLRQIDDLMLQSMPAELFNTEQRTLAKRERRLRRHNNMQKLCCSNPQQLNTLARSSNEDAEEETSPIFFQQQILARRQRQAAKQQQQQCRLPNPQKPAQFRQANIVTLNQPALHFYHYQEDDLFSETSVIGTYEERACSIAKCMHWMSRLSEEDQKAVAHQQQQQQQQQKTSPVKQVCAGKPPRPNHHHQQSPVIATGAGEALAIPPNNVFEYHHIHTHKHFVARV